MTSPFAVREQVVAAVAAATALPVDAVLAADSLFDLPGFDSLAVVEILARLESVFAVDVAAEAVLPEVFERVSGLTELVLDALGPAARAGTGKDSS